MAAIAAQTVSSLANAGLTLTAASGGGDTIVPRKNGVLIVKNGGGAPVNLTFVVPGNDSLGTARPDVVKAIPNTGNGQLFVLSDELLQDADTGLINLTWSAVTSVTVGYVVPA